MSQLGIKSNTINSTLETPITQGIKNDADSEIRQSRDDLPPELRNARPSKRGILARIGAFLFGAGAAGGAAFGFGAGGLVGGLIGVGATAAVGIATGGAALIGGAVALGLFAGIKALVSHFRRAPNPEPRIPYMLREPAVKTQSGKPEKLNTSGLISEKSSQVSQASILNGGGGMFAGLEGKDFNDALHYSLYNDFYEDILKWPHEYKEALENGLKDAWEQFPGQTFDLKSLLDKPQMKSFRTNCHEAVDPNREKKLTPKELRALVKDAIIKEARLKVMADWIDKKYQTMGMPPKSDYYWFRNTARGILGDLEKVRETGGDSAREAEELLTIMNTGNEEALLDALPRLDARIENYITMSDKLSGLRAKAKENVLSQLKTAFNVKESRLKELVDKFAHHLAILGQNIRLGLITAGENGLEGLYDNAVKKFLTPYLAHVENTRKADISPNLKDTWINEVLKATNKPFNPKYKINQAVIKAGTELDVSAIMTAARRKPVDAQALHTEILNVLSKAVRDAIKLMPDHQEIEGAGNDKFGADEKKLMFQHLMQVIFEKHPGLREALQPLQNKLNELNNEYLKQQPKFGSPEHERDEFSTRLEMGTVLVQSL